MSAWDSVIPARSADAPLDSRTVLGGGPPVAPEELPYELEERPQPPPVPNGWYALAASGDLGAGQVTSTVAAARELVLYRSADGAPHVLDAHCPHLGAHLGGGDVHGDTLACPYHGWRFAGAGECTEIPYSQARIPSRACVRSYPVREQDGIVLFWFHIEDSPPTYEVPTVAEVGDPAYADAIEYRTEFAASLQDMAENNVDYTHFHFVHRREALDDSTSQFSTDGPFSTVVERFEGDGAGGGAGGAAGGESLTFTRYTYGPGVALLRVPDLMTVLTTTTPIDRRHVRLLWHFFLPVGLTAVAEEIIDGVTGAYGLEADVPIWRDKVFRDRPLLVKGDGPVNEFRRWYSQFYEGR